jgi:hypothetical protein
VHIKPCNLFHLVLWVVYDCVGKKYICSDIFKLGWYAYLRDRLCCQCCIVVTHCYFSTQDLGRHHIHLRYSWSLQLACVPVPNLIYQQVYEIEGNCVWKRWYMLLPQGLMTFKLHLLLVFSKLFEHLHFSFYSIVTAETSVQLGQSSEPVLCP